MRRLIALVRRRPAMLPAPRGLGRAFQDTAVILGLLLLVTPALSDQAAPSIPEPQYFSPPFSDKPSRLAVAPDGRVWVSIPSQGTVAAFNPATNGTEEYVVPEGMKPGKLLPLRDKVLFLLTKQDMLGVLVTGSTQPFTVKLPGQPYDIAPSPSGFWLSIPDSENVLLLRGDNFTSVASVEVAVAYGEDVICETGEKLWVITSDYRNVALVDIQSMETSYIALPERAYGLTPSSNESVSLISSEGNLMYLSASQQIQTYPLPQGTSASSHLVPDKQGGVWYCDSARNRVVFRDRKGLAERALPGVRPKSPSASPDGYLWFIDDEAGRLGRVRMSVSSSKAEPSTTTATSQVSTTTDQQQAGGPTALLLVQIALAMVLLVAILTALLRKRASHKKKSKRR